MSIIASGAWSLLFGLLAWIPLLPATQADSQAVNPPAQEASGAAQIDRIRAAAAKGDAEAQFALGISYYWGNGVPENFREACTWFLKAAEQGNTTAEEFLRERLAATVGNMYKDGDGVRQDYKEAARWYRIGAEQGEVTAQSNLGFLYSKGQGVPQDHKEAVTWFRKAAEQGYATAQFNLGLSYAHGEGVPQDYKEAVAWYRKAAEQGHAAAQSNLGLLYGKGQGVPQDYKEAVAWYRKAAGQGNAEAQYNLAVEYYTGQGVPQDYREAVTWFRKAAEQGYAGAQYNLGVAYTEGQGVPQDYKEAVAWYRRAAEQGYAAAQSNLGVAYTEGQGVPQDYREAVIWIRKAAEQGVATAQFNLGLLYGKGQGVPQDWVQGHLWLNLAASSGDSQAASLRDSLARKMSPAQVEQAQSLARAWRPKRSSQPATQSPVVSGDDSALSRPDITGSGFVLSAHDVLTNYHVIESCSTIRFVGPAGTQLLRVAATDAHNDLAVLRSESIFASTATLSDGRAAKLGESVVAVGFPLRGLLTSSMTVTTGTVSATAGPGDDSRFLQVTAPVQPGSSGGPVLDLSGRVIGVVVSKLDFRTTLKTAGEIPENVNFAIKVALVREFLDAHDISYRSTPPSATSAVTDIAAQARQFTIAIECWK